MSNAHSDNSFLEFTNSYVQQFVEVIVPLALPTNYTWSVPQHLSDKIKVGQRIEVQLRNKKYTGVVKTIHRNKPDAFEPLDIINILEEEPLVHEKQLQLWQWMGNYYMCSEGEVMQAAVPSNLKLSSESVLIWNEEHEYDLNDGTSFDDEEYIVAQALEIKKELRLSEVQQLVSANHVYGVIKKLIDKRICYVWEELKEKYKIKTEIQITLHPDYLNEKKLEQLMNEWSKAPKQLELLLAFLHLQKAEGEVIQPELLKKANASAAQLKGLIEKNILIATVQQADRVKALPALTNISFELSALQQNALQNIKQSFETFNVSLLHGVTASGKTQLYIQLMHEYVQQQKQVLYMLPEIALTAQTIRRLQQYFGGNIVIYHSKLNANERVEIWNKIKTGKANMVLGARSALFLPFQNLGLIIVDEEHDPSFKQQDPAPRYHARDTAIYYASLFKAKVLLGTATPSLESYDNAQQKKYGLVTLPERYGNVNLPTIELIDLKQVVTKEKGKIPLSPQLIEAIQTSLQQRKQVIIFQNRRGFSPYIICTACGWIPHCKYCDVSLTYHKSKGKLSCHYCGTTYPVINTCAACGSSAFNQKNFGTEKVEELIATQFPDAKVARMDLDTVKGKHDHDTIIKLFEQQRINILVGTQMVVKGLDFENVNLVGIIDADGLLNFTDFRVNERAFQLMEQVSGRAGRKDGHGKVLIQVSNLYHPVLNFVKLHDYEMLYRFELESRKLYQYPPFTRLIIIKVKHKENHIAEAAAKQLKDGLHHGYAANLTGPAQPPIERIRNQYIWELLLKLPKDAAFIQQCKKQVQHQIIALTTQASFKSITVVVDVDPV